MLFSLNRLLATAAGVASLSTALLAQGGAARVFTADDYRRAERFMGYNTNPLVLHGEVRPTWVSDDRFWYRTTTGKGPETFLVDATTGSKSPCDLPACKAPGAGGRGGGRGAARTDAPSPDGKKTAFIRDWNLWVRDVTSGKETQLTKDGVKDFGYAT